MEHIRRQEILGPHGFKKRSYFTAWNLYQMRGVLKEMPNGTGVPSEYINSILRAMTILELFEKLNVQYLGIADISKEMGLHKTTVFRIVKTLERQGWLVQDSANRKYKLSSKLIRLASSVTRNFSVEDIILQEMKDLRDQFNEDVVLTAMVDDIAVCLERMQSKNVLRIYSRVGRSSSLVRGSTGKTLLAFQPDVIINKVLDRNFPFTAEGERSRQQLLSSLEQIRTDRYCSTTSELDEGISSVTVPIFDKDGKICYSLGVLGEQYRMEQKGLSNILEALQACVCRIEAEIRIFDSN